MILIYALIFIFAEPIIEGLLKRFNKAEWLFDDYTQWATAIFLFALWFIIAINFNGYYVPIWKLILGFVFVRFAIFDVTINLVWGQKWDYYGTTKLYDRIMYELGSFGWMMKVISGIIGIVFLLGYS